MDAEEMTTEGAILKVAMAAEGAASKVTPVEIPLKYQSLHGCLEKGLPRPRRVPRTRRESRSRHRSWGVHLLENTHK